MMLIVDLTWIMLRMKAIVHWKQLYTRFHVEYLPYIREELFYENYVAKVLDGESPECLRNRP